MKEENEILVMKKDREVVVVVKEVMVVVKEVVVDQEREWMCRRTFYESRNPLIK